MKRLTLFALACLLGSCSKPVQASSTILGVSLPGALPAERSLDSITKTTQEMARNFQEECGPVEAFEVVDITKTRQAITEAISKQGYQKRLITTLEGSEVYTLSGPKRLMVVDTTASIGLCEVTS